MSTRLAPAERYVECWNETDAGARRDAVAALWAEDGRYVDPLGDAEGRDAIDATSAAVQERRPGPRSGCAMRASTATTTQPRFTWRAPPRTGAEAPDRRLRRRHHRRRGRLARVLGCLDEAPPITRIAAKGISVDKPTNRSPSSPGSGSAAGAVATAALALAGSGAWTAGAALGGLVLDRPRVGGDGLGALRRVHHVDHARGLLKFPLPPVIGWTHSPCSERARGGIERRPVHDVNLSDPDGSFLSHVPFLLESGHP